MPPVIFRTEKNRLIFVVCFSFCNVIVILFLFLKEKEYLKFTEALKTNLFINIQHPKSSYAI